MVVWSGAAVLCDSDSLPITTTYDGAMMSLSLGTAVAFLTVSLSVCNHKVFIHSEILSDCVRWSSCVMQC